MTREVIDRIGDVTELARDNPEGSVIALFALERQHRNHAHEIRADYANRIEKMGIKTISLRS